VKKWKNACKEWTVTKNALEELTTRLDTAWIADWKGLEKTAAEKQGDALKIYDGSIMQGMTNSFFSWWDDFRAIRC
jgi:hypothetical protein